MITPAPIPPVFVVSAPSGTGKTTLNRRLVKEHPEVELSVSYTTRAKRQGEIEGVHYHFVTREYFQGLIDRGEMLEYAEVFGTLYGTPKDELRRLAQAGKKALLEIDVQGWKQAKGLLPGAVSIFILPPSVETLWQRLEGRGTEPLAVRWRRLMAAKAEIESGGNYDHFIVNHSLEGAYSELQGIIINGEKSKMSAANGAALCQDLLREFATAPWIDALRAELSKAT
ncbi:MAG: guanylate kinase [Deltaproteobacteria bacterium]|nr:guanylate kinase [Deltaproteobacteria bacterium]